MRVIKKLMFRVLLEEAIMQEEAAYRFYEDALNAVSEPEIVNLLKRLMAGELLHKIKLEEVQRAGALTPQALSEEIPIDVEHATEPPAKITPGVTSHDILCIALAKEQYAVKRYTQLHTKAIFTFARDVFRALAQEEARHVEWIQTQLEADSSAEASPEVLR